MEITLIKINFYKTINGKIPVIEFLESLTIKENAKITWTLNLIESLPVIPKQYFKKLVNTEDLWEIRILFAGNIFRILCFFDGNNIIILNHAFRKKTQKTPKQDILIAEERKRDYVRRKKHE